MAILCDIVDFASSSGTPVTILSLGQEKAFDHVDCSVMRSTLSAMGFGPSFISWVHLFYHRVQSAVNVNDYFSSPLLYVLVSEVLATNICCNPHISGLRLPGCDPLSGISQDTDDSSCHLTMLSKLRSRRMLSLRRFQAPG